MAAPLQFVAFINAVPGSSAQSLLLQVFLSGETVTNTTAPFVLTLSDSSTSGAAKTNFAALLSALVGAGKAPSVDAAPTIQDTVSSAASPCTVLASTVSSDIKIQVPTIGATTAGNDAVYTTCVLFPSVSTPSALAYFTASRALPSTFSATMTNSSGAEYELTPSLFFAQCFASEPAMGVIAPVAKTPSGADVPNSIGCMVCPNGATALPTGLCPVSSGSGGGGGGGGGGNGGGGGTKADVNKSAVRDAVIVGICFVGLLLLLGFVRKEKAKRAAEASEHAQFEQLQRMRAMQGSQPPMQPPMQQRPM